VPATPSPREGDFILCTLHFIISSPRWRFFLSPDEKGKRCFLQFDAAAHIATVYVNGRELKTHRCGYTAFRVEFTEVAVWGAENLVAVRLDSTENSSIPPFGFVIDYLTYGGLYRPAYMELTALD
jgi:beta-galactosidase